MVRFSNEALADLRAIRDYIGLETPVLARIKAQEIVNACQRLDHFPQMGRKGREAGTREITIKPWVAVYQVTPDGPLIVHIWHGRQSRRLVP